VADRFHLLINLRKALEPVLDRAHASLRTRLGTALSSPEVDRATRAIALFLTKDGTSGMIINEHVHLLSYQLL